MAPSAVRDGRKEWAVITFSRANFRSDGHYLSRGSRGFFCHIGPKQKASRLWGPAAAALLSLHTVMT